MKTRLVSGGYFTVLGATASIGRTFTAADEHGAVSVTSDIEFLVELIVQLGHRCVGVRYSWRSQTGGDSMRASFPLPLPPKWIGKDHIMTFVEIHAEVDFWFLS